MPGKLNQFSMTLAWMRMMKDGRKTSKKPVENNGACVLLCLYNCSIWRRNVFNLFFLFFITDTHWAGGMRAMRIFIFIYNSHHLFVVCCAYTITPVRWCKHSIRVESTRVTWMDTFIIITFTESEICCCIRVLFVRHWAHTQVSRETKNKSFIYERLRSSSALL